MVLHNGNTRVDVYCCFGGVAFGGGDAAAGGEAGGMTAVDGRVDTGVLGAAVTGVDTVPGGTVAVPGAATAIG
jgi:hypothetical protein